jgi:hypothetical protein
MAKRSPILLRRNDEEGASQRVERTGMPKDPDIEMIRRILLVAVDHVFIGAPGLEPAKARILAAGARGLREAFRDVLEASGNLPPEPLARLDASLRSEGLPSIHRLQDRIKRSLIVILTRGLIKSESEYRLVDRFVSDVDSAELSLQERSLANRMLSEYESNR